MVENIRRSCCYCGHHSHDANNLIIDNNTTIGEIMDEELLPEDNNINASDEEYLIYSINTEDSGIRLCDKILLSILLIIVATGIIAGGFLLYTEGIRIRPYSNLKLITKNELNLADVNQLTKLQNPVESLLLISVNSTDFHLNSQRCNFISTSDGSIYEVLGWKYRSSQSKLDNIATICVVAGNYLEDIKTSQAKSILEFSKLSILQGKLINCRDINVLSENRVLIDLAINIAKECCKY